MSAIIDDALLRARQDLLDLSTRNRLIHTPRGRSRSTSVDIVDELADQVFQRLVVDGKPMTFLPSGDEDDSEDSLPEEFEDSLDQPDDEPSNGQACARHTDDKLQTSLPSKTLQGRLLRLYCDARNYEEEQGVNILFLAIGFLKWFESDSSTQERFSPLLLVPVKLDRPSVGAKFKVFALEEEIATNLSLQAKLKQDFQLALPDVPDEDDFTPSEYFSKVQIAIAGKHRWEVLTNGMTLWFYSFAKFLMFRDLDPKTWPEGHGLSERPNIEAAVSGGFGCDPPILDDDDNLDGVLDPIDLCHVVDADGSQSVVIEEVRRGQHLVVQGPPGTGKSQTITNMIAAAIKEGKKVLFVAEKMAALEVVKRRMDKVGLGAACLELHSHKANKKAMLADIGEALTLKRPQLVDLQEQVNELRRLRDQLNDHAASLHTPLQPVGLTAYDVLGEIIRLNSDGSRTYNFKLDNPLTWTRVQLNHKMALVQDLATHLNKVGNPKGHPWRGVGIGSLLPADLQRLMERVSELIPRLDKLISSGTALAQILELPPPASAQQLSKVALIAQQLCKAPPLDPIAISCADWERNYAGIQEIIQSGETYTGIRNRLLGRVEEGAWQTDVASLRRQLHLRHKSWFRWLNRDYRRAVKTLEEICTDSPPDDIVGQLELLDQLIMHQHALKSIDSTSTGDRLGRAAFGKMWNGPQSDWNHLQRIAQWVVDSRKAVPDVNCRDILSKQGNLNQCKKFLTGIVVDFKRCLSDLQQLFQSLEIDLRDAFGTPQFTELSLATIRERLRLWQQTPESIQKWISYRLRLHRMRDEGASQFTDLVHRGAIDAASAPNQFSKAYYETVMREFYKRYPALAEFDGDSHEQARTTFRKLDVLRIELARKEASVAHYQGIPKSSSLGEMAKIHNELQKKRKHWPIRKLLREAGHAIQAIKPVFMMSPTSIAQFLEPGGLEFDLLLIDEASQVRPIEAFGAMARCRQIVVVGDDKQMPPTTFFSKLMVDDGDDGELANTGDLESILGLCLARGMRSRMLSWHYRSRHHSLIAVSNCEFYNNRLFVIPSPEAKSDGLGLELRHVSNGVFDRGGSATNRVEAHCVAEAVMRHARTSPTLSLGVGAFSVAQRDAIIDELERLRRQETNLEPFFSTASSEPFFVKNLENLQGDERDVIFISVGYGPDKDGYITMGFGPLSFEGGERRLNVLISRARDRCEVFSSLRADDIDLNRAKARGAAVLKQFLKYAETGWLDVAHSTGGDHDSVFEEQVAKAIRDHGYDVEAQVGAAGFFIDLAVKDPEKPGRYLLGVECDGATYHSARWARDRDRLRQDVLESRGWKIYRIWSTDWFRQPHEQVRRLLQAIECAKLPDLSQDKRPDESSPCQETALEHKGHAESLPDDMDEHVVEVGSSFRIYKEADLSAMSIDTRRPIHESPMQLLEDAAANVIAVEGPIHIQEVARRVAEFWGARRTTEKMVSAIEQALQSAKMHGRVIADGDFYSLPSVDKVPVRSREEVVSATLRQPDRLPPAEIREAICQIVAGHVGVTPEEVIVAVGRMLGFKSTGQQLKRLFSQELEQLLALESLQQRDGRLFTERN